MTVTFERGKTNPNLIPYLMELNDGGFIRGYLYQYGPFSYGNDHDTTKRYPSRYAALRSIYANLKRRYVI